MRLLSLDYRSNFQRTVAIAHCDPRESRHGPLGHRTTQDGADGDRTHDLRLAKPALSQLSYSPAPVRRRDDGPR